MLTLLKLVQEPCLDAKLSVMETSTVMDSWIWQFQTQIQSIALLVILQLNFSWVILAVLTQLQQAPILL